MAIRSGTNGFSITPKGDFALVKIWHKYGDRENLKLCQEFPNYYEKKIVYGSHKMKKKY